MNHFYRLVRSADGTRYVAVPETAKGQGKASKAVASVSVLLGLVAVGGQAWAQAPSAHALPTGGQVAAGQAQIGQSGNQMTVNQGSDRAVINWQGFDIGSQAAVRFNQPGTSSVALNRVVAGDASQIHGQLSANGQVWVLNPNGVVFGQGSRVDVGGLVASTMHSSDADFMAGKAVFSRNGSTASVINQGEITAHGDGAQAGLVALLAPTVKNEGVIRAQLGNVAMAAGERITLSAGVGGKLQMAVDPSTVQTLIENKQLIVADGGQVLMTSRAADALSAGVVSNTGTVQARTLAHQEGRIVLLADMQHGTTEVAGLLDASAPEAGGNGGFVDTSAARVQIQAGTRVSTRAASGKTGQWLIDPTDFTISAGGATRTTSGIGADTLVANLANTDVTLQTVDTGSEAGSIHVNADVRYSANQLTLNAHRDININATIDVGPSGKLALNYGNTQGDVAKAPAAGSQLSVKGQVNFAQSGTDLLSINGQDYTVIQDVGSLQAMGLTGYYALGGDIDASATASWNCNAGTCNGFRPIGSNGSGTDVTRFTGSFDGMGHSIRNLTVKVTQPQYTNFMGETYSYAGLFGVAGSSARIAHVGLENANVQASGGNFHYAGALVGWNSGGSISQSYATGSAKAEGGRYNYAGALVGRNDGGSISQSYATGSATALDGVSNFAGALVGSNGGSVSQSYATGSATASGLAGGSNYAGALVGYSWDSIEQSYATGSATASGESSFNYAGALVGRNDGSILQSYATGSATTSGGNVNYAGALVGDNFNGGSIRQSYATGSATATGGSFNFAGALVGRNVGSISESYWDQDSSGMSAAAGDSLASGTSPLNAITRYQHSSYGGLGTWSETTAGSGIWVAKDAQGKPQWIMFEGRTRPFLYSEYSTRIGNAHQLQLMAYDLGANYTLVRDIDAAATQGGSGTLGNGMWSQTNGFVPIGNDSSYTDASRFIGSFDGQGHSIRNLTVKVTVPQSAGISYAGLFGVTGSNAHIAHVGLENANIQALGGAFSNNVVGALVGSNGGSIRQSYAMGSATASGLVGSANYAGALVGHNWGSIEQSYVMGSATAEEGGYNYAGALVGINSGQISQSYATGSAMAAGGGTNSAGALVGYSSGSISQSYAMGSATASGRGANYAGALVGYNEYSSIEQSYATGSATASGGGENYAGTLVGRNNGGTISNSYWDQESSGLPVAVGNVTAAGVNKLDATTRYQHSSYGGLGTWSETTAGSGIWVAKDAQGKPQWIMFEGRTRPFLYSEYSTRIGNAHQLQLMAYDLGANYTLVRDIDAAATQGGSGTLGNGMWSQTNGFVPIGSNSSDTDATRFTGSFDGQGYSIGNLTVKVTEPQYTGFRYSYAGLFGVTGSNARIAHVGLENANIQASGGGVNSAGALVGSNYYGSVSQSYATGSATASGGDFNYAGALVGRNGGNISQSYATGSATASGGGSNYAGALVGENNGGVSASVGSISQSYATGSATASGGSTNYAGALVGYHFWGSIEQSYAMGSATASGGSGSTNYAGALVGENWGSISQSYWSTAAGLNGVGKNNGILDAESKGLSLTDFQKASSFAAWGNTIDDQGGTGAVWRIYEGQSTPLLRAFLKQITVNVSGSKVYDAGTGIALSNYSLQGLSPERGSLLGSLVATSKNVGRYNAADNSFNGLYSNQQGYDISYQGSLEINKALLTVTGISATDKVYDGGTVAEMTGTGSVTGLGSDVLTLSGAGVGHFADKNVGNGKQVTVTGYTLTGADAGNYELQQPTGLTASITPKGLTVTGITAADKVYDGGTVATLTGSGSVTGLGSDVLILSGAAVGHFADKNVGNGKQVTVTGYTLTGADAGNYQLLQPTGVTASITPRGLTVTASANNKVYDGRTDASAALHDDRVEGDVLTLSYTSSSFSDKNAGMGKAVTVNGITLGGADAGNYTFNTSASTTADINKALLMVTGSTAADKVYDGSTTARINAGTLQGLVNNETLGVSATGQFDSANAGARSATAQYTLADGTGLASNYIVAGTTGHSATITPRALTVAGTTADGKVYDGSATAKINAGTLQGLVNNETLGVSATGQFDSANAGDRSATAQYMLADGSHGGLASNYIVADTTGHSATITPKALTVAGSTADGKVYDGSTTARIHAGTLLGLVNNETLGVSATGQFDSTNAGARSATAQYTLADGTGLASNYTVADTTGHSATITPRALTVAGSTAADKVYDGSTTARINAGTLQGLVNNETLGVSATGQFDSANAGERSATAQYTLADGTGLASNYTVADTTGHSATITPKALTITAGNAQKTVGETLVFLGHEFTAQGLVGAEQIQSVQLGSAGAAAHAAAGSYAIVASGLRGGTGFDARNYDIRYVDGQLQVQAQRSTLGAGDLWRLYSPQLGLQPSQRPAPQNVPAQKKPLLTIDPDYIQMVGL